MTPREILVAARAKIAKPENWTKGSYARNTYGERVPETRPDAFCFCAAGAVCSLFPDAIADADVWRPLRDAMGLSPDDQLHLWNDAPERTHSEVLAAFDRAIAICPE